MNQTIKKMKKFFIQIVKKVANEFTLFFKINIGPLEVSLFLCLLIGLMYLKSNLLESPYDINLIINNELRITILYDYKNKY